MKLLKLKINEGGFKSLQQGFEINFHTLDDIEAMQHFGPFCFAGLNGSGKSNVLEALSAIFYHLEFLVARFRPKSFENHFSRTNSYPDAYELEYLIAEKDSLVGVPNMVKVSIVKKANKEPVMHIEENGSWLEGKKNRKAVSFKPPTDKKVIVPGKKYLPDNIVAYSSGENETLSIPYLKCRLVHYDEYIEAIKSGLSEYLEPENSFIYIDSNMSQAVLLSNLIIEDVIVEKENSVKDGALKSFKEEIGIVGLQSFRMNINLASLKDLEIPEKVKESYPKYFLKNHKGELVIIQLLAKRIEELKKCATCFYENENQLALTFHVNEATKQAFKKYFNSSSFELFQLFRLLYELNSFTVDEDTKEDVYKSKGYYTDWKLPQLVPKDNIFAFTDFFIIKKDGEDKLAETRLLKEFSDGEHQFIHTMGICMMLKDRRALLLLDEPETHFNPAWRAKFIKLLNDSIADSAPIPIKKIKENEIEVEIHPAINNLDYYVQKDIILTSHSPFIISDCLPNNVILFEKDKEGNVSAKSASEKGIDTYGTSVNILTNRIFKNKETIGNYAMGKMNELKKRFDGKENREYLVNALNAEFGDSIEKLLLIKEVTSKD